MAASDVPRFELLPRGGRENAMLVLAIPVIAALGLLVVSIENHEQMPWVVPIAGVLCIGVAVLWWWLARRTAPLELTIDGDALAIASRHATHRGTRSELAGELGCIKPAGRGTGGVRYPAISFTVGRRRLVVMSTGAATPRSERELRGQTFELAPDRFKRLVELLRLT